MSPLVKIVLQMLHKPKKESNSIWERAKAKIERAIVKGRGREHAMSYWCSS